MIRGAGTEQTVNRIESIDGLRGLLACGVMIYHLNLAEKIYPVGGLVSGFLAKVGIYGVCAFFIISGYGLYMGYSQKIRSGELSTYFKRRYLRIAPLYWLALMIRLVLSIPEYSFKGGEHVIYIILNILLLFGFVDAGRSYLVGGGWSIGIEFMYYLLLPVLLVMGRNWLSLSFFLLGSAVISLSWGYWMFIHGQSLASQWEVYVSPFWFSFFFIAGVFFAALRKEVMGSINAFWCWGSIVMGSAIFMLVSPLPSDQIDVVWGWNQAFLSISIVAVVVGVAYVRLTGIPAVIAKFLGQTSYSIYLLHPIVYVVLSSYIEAGKMRAAATILVTIPVAWLVYRYFESFFLTNRGRPSKSVFR